jgi:YD repeat-containing protein
MASKLTKVVANFETSLATKLANGATSGALTSITDKNSASLPNGKYCMIIDRGTGDEEHLLFDLVSNAISNIVSVSRQGVQTAGVQNLNGHRAGAKCYLTDFVNLKLIVDILNGADTLDAANPIKYDADPTYTDSKQLVSKGYVDTKVALFVSTLLAGNNVFAGLNSFTQSPQVPTPTTANDATNMSYVLSLVFGGVVAGVNKMTVNYDTQGRVKNVRDNELGKIYIVSYDTQDNPIKIFDGTSTWRLNYSNDRLVSITKP